MIFGISFGVCCTVFIAILAIVYFTKARIDTEENKLYSKLLILTIIGLLIEITCNWTAIMNYSPDSLFVICISRIFLVFMLYWSIFFTDYVTIIAKGKHIYTQKKIYDICIFLIAIAIAALPLSFYNDGIVTYSYGLGIILIYIIDIILIIYDICLIIKNHKKITMKKMYPLFLLIALMIILAIVKAISPGINLMTSMFAFVVFLMYHTIENPDVKMVEQLDIAKNQAEKANAAKTEFLSSMSHEIRTPLNAIVGFSDYIINSNSLEEAKENAQDIVNASQTLLEIVNGILDISKIEAGKLEIINTKYTAKTTFESLAKLITPKMQEKG